MDVRAASASASRPPSGTDRNPATLIVADPYKAESARSRPSASCTYVGAQIVTPFDAPLARKNTMHSARAAGLLGTMDTGPTPAVPDPEAATAPTALAAADPDADPDTDADADANDDPDADEASVARAPARGTGASRNIFIRTTQTTRPAAP